MWKWLIRPLFFALPAEQAHYFTMGLFRFANQIPGVGACLERKWRFRDPRLQSELWGLSFDNPVGLAAGFDKNGRWIEILPRLGFGSIEIGSITGEGQPGNPRPRLFRLPADEAIINRMGFNNDGADALASRLERYAPRARGACLLGINLGKTKRVPLEQAEYDYERSFRALYRYADYFAVNVSSPNTPGLRTLQDRQPLERLLTRLNEVNRELARSAPMGDREQRPRAKDRAKPVLLKIAPDLNNHQLDEIADLARTPLVDGLIATNTTISRSGLKTAPRKVEQIGAGGLSGRPLLEHSCQVVHRLHTALEGSKPIIGVGGIFTAADAWRMICSGASLLQVYTGFIYEGPGMVRRINQGLLNEMDRRGLEHLRLAVGRRDWLP